MESFNIYCVSGIEFNKEKIDYYLYYFLMLVIVLNLYVGYENVVKIVKNVYKKGIFLKESVLELKFLSVEDFDKFVVFEKMIGFKV